MVLQLSVCDVKDKRVQEKHVAKIKKFEQDLHEYLGDILDVASCGFGIYRPVEAHPKVRMVRLHNYKEALFVGSISSAILQQLMLGCTPNIQQCGRTTKK